MTATLLELSGLDGTNPLGFLAALGTVVTARRVGETHARLRWKHGRTWTPVIEGISTPDRAEWAELLARELHGHRVSPDDEERREKAQREFDEAKKRLKKKREEIKKRRLGRDERKTVDEQEVRPLQEDCEHKRQKWLAALKKAIPSPELALGKRIDCTPAEFRGHADAMLSNAGHRDREALDLLAAFGSDACQEETADSIVPTPFCFIKGSGGQYFLDTALELMGKATSERVTRALFEPWTYSDERFSMRWDPAEDRRYALMDRDPTAPGNETRTVWMANLLAYRALVLFPSTPTSRGLATTGWIRPSDETSSFTWPIWEFLAGPETIRSMLQLRELAEPALERSSLRARGISAVYRSRRIRVGKGSNFKLNFSPARPV